MSAKYHDLENKRIFVTGGGLGIGASIIEHFCEQNSEVYFVDINVEGSNKLISDIKNKNFKIPNYKIMATSSDYTDVYCVQKEIKDIWRIK